MNRLLKLENNIQTTFIILTTIGGQKKSWVKAYRNSWLINKNHTNNYAENTIRQIKDKVFSRVKAFNLVQLTDFMLTKFEDYIKRKLLDSTYNRATKIFFNSQIKMPLKEMLERIVQLDHHIIAVPSETTKDLIYLVNLEILLCSCRDGNTGNTSFF